MRNAKLRAAPLAAALAAILSLPAPASALESADDGARDRRTAEFKTVEVVGEQASGYAAKRSRTATKTDTALLDTPQSITVVTQELIRDQAMQGMAEVVRYVPGVGMAQGEGNRDTPIFRGSSTTADMFIDGMRDDTQYFRDLYNIDRVEALKGPNAMIFGRGGSGGLLNRVSKQADGNTVRRLGLQLGSWDKYRVGADIGQALNDSVAFRVTALFENTDSYRDDVEARRRGINPTLALRAGDNTTITVGYEHFEDERTADRGISSFLGKPLDVDPSTFFGDPDRSRASVDVDAFNMLVDHDFGNGITLRNRTRYATYDKFYQNVFPGTVSANGTVAISAYNDATQRDNLFNQTDLNFKLSTGSVEHIVLAGMELGRQETDSFRNTGFFPPTTCPPPSSPTPTTSVRVPVSDPRYTGPLCFSHRTSDADNHSVAKVAALYAQDQIEFSPHWQAIIGLRYDRFEVDVRNNNTGADFASSDNLWSPRVGLVYKPFETFSLYSSYSVAYLPRSGDQMSSLSASNESLEPEKFNNIEFGAKWDVRPSLSATAAVYQLNRSNVAVVDPLDSSKLILLSGDSQRVRGVELGLSGKITENWSVMGGIAFQDGEITKDIKTSPSATLPKGTILAQVPRRTFSLWNRYDFNSNWGVGLGVISRSSMYASTSNNVSLPGFARVDGAVFYRVNETLRMQLNIENLFDKNYFASAHSDTNITPGSPRAFNLGINLDF
jgi:catecholate siderophore receptor